MDNEKILYYLGILEDGALNYYQAIETIRIARQSIQNYIVQLEQQCKKQKEVIDKITEIINYYGVDKEYNDNVILRHILKDMLDILKEVSE